MPRRFDRFKFETLAPPRKHRDGYWIVEGRAARIGVQDYHVVQADGSTRLVREFRPPEQVFRKESLESFEGVPVTVDHPDEPVTAENATKYSRGAVLQYERDADGYHVRARLALQSRDAVRALEAGKMELSAGYDADVVPGPGKWGGLDGSAVHEYDAVQTNILGNHLALVDVARAGPTARIRLDAFGHASVQGDSMPIKVTLPNGKEITVDSEEQATALRATFDTQAKALKDAAEETARAKATADAAKAELDRARTDADKAKADAEKNAKTDADKAKADAQRKDHAALVEKAQGYLPGKGLAELLAMDSVALMEAAVLAHDSGAKFDGVPADQRPVYVRARFDMLPAKKVDAAEAARIAANAARSGATEPKADELGSEARRDAALRAYHQRAMKGGEDDASRRAAER